MSTTLFHPKPRPWRTVSTSCWILSNAHGPIEEALALLGDVVPAERARDADELALRVVHGDAHAGSGATGSRSGITNGSGTGTGSGARRRTVRSCRPTVRARSCNAGISPSVSSA